MFIFHMKVKLLKATLCFSLFLFGSVAVEQLRIFFSYSLPLSWSYFVVNCSYCCSNCKRCNLLKLSSCRLCLVDPRIFFTRLELHQPFQFWSVNWPDIWWTLNQQKPIAGLQSERIKFSKLDACHTNCKHWVALDLSLYHLNISQETAIISLLW